MSMTIREEIGSLLYNINQATEKYGCLILLDGFLPFAVADLAVSYGTGRGLIERIHGYLKKR